MKTPFVLMSAAAAGMLAVAGDSTAAPSQDQVPPAAQEDTQTAPPPEAGDSAAGEPAPEPEPDVPPVPLEGKKAIPAAEVSKGFPPADTPPGVFPEGAPMGEVSLRSYFPEGFGVVVVKRVKVRRMPAPKGAKAAADSYVVVGEDGKDTDMELQECMFGDLDDLRRLFRQVKKDVLEVELTGHEGFCSQGLPHADAELGETLADWRDHAWHIVHYFAVMRVRE